MIDYKSAVVGAGAIASTDGASTFLGGEHLPVLALSNAIVPFEGAASLDRSYLVTIGFTVGTRGGASTLPVTFVPLAGPTCNALRATLTKTVFVARMFVELIGTLGYTTLRTDL